MNLMRTAHASRHIRLTDEGGSDMESRFEASSEGVRDRTKDPDFYRDVVDRAWYLKALDYVKGNGKQVTLILIVFVLAICALYTLYAAGQETRVRNRLAAEVKKSEVTYDTMWKIIKEQFNLSEQ